MIVWSFIVGIFWALIIAAILWILCAFAGRLVNSNYRMPLLLHLLCFAIAVPTVVLLTIVFSCNKINRKLTDMDACIVKLLMTDEKFVNHLQQELLQVSTTDVKELTKNVAENFSEKISSEYSAVRKYVDINQILEKPDFGKQMSKLAQGEITIGKMQEVMQAAAGEFTKGIRSKVKSVRRKALFVLLFLQAFPFGINFYRANKHRSTVSDFFYESNNYL